MSCSLHPAGNGEGRFWLLGVHRAAFPVPSPASSPASHSHGRLLFRWDISTLPLSWSSPQGGKLPTSGLLHCHDLPFSLAPCPGHCPSCGAIAWQGLQELCRLRRAKPSPKDQAQVPRPLGNGPAKSQLCDLPAWNLLVTAWERKEAIKKVLFAL